MKIIREGKIQGWFDGFLVLLGFLIAYYTFIDNRTTFGLWIGLAIGSIGGYSAQAKTLQIKSFGNLTFPKNKPEQKPSKIEKLLDNISFIITMSAFPIILFWDPAFKFYIDIYIIAITIFVVFVLIIVAYILFNASLEKIKEVKATNNANTIKYYEVGVLDFSRHDNWDDVAQYVDQNLTLTAVSHNKQHILYKSFSSNGRIIEIRMNDFPDEPLYTLLEHGIEIIHFNNLPKNWIIQK